MRSVAAFQSSLSQQHQSFQSLSQQHESFEEMTVRAWFKLDDGPQVGSVAFDATEIVDDVKRKIKGEGAAKLRDVAVWEMAL